MSKNLTRKSAALGAVVALGASLFAGTPAHAAAELTIAPNAGTAYNVLTNDAFVLKAYGNTDFSISATTDLRWKVTKSATASITYLNNAGTNSTTPTADATNSTATVQYMSSNNEVATAGGNTLSINPATTVDDPTVTVTVQAWVEVDGDGLPGANELKSAVQTVKFLGSADVVATPVLSNAIVGQYAKVTVTIPGLNYAQTSSGSAQAQFYTNGSADGSPTAVALAKNTAEDALEASQAAVGANNGTAGVKVQAKNYEGTGTAWKDVSSVVYSDVSSSTADTVSSFGIATSADIRKTTGTNDYTKSVTSSGDISQYVARTGTKSFTVTQIVKKTTGGLATAVGAGVPVTVTVSEDGGDTVAAGTVISAGGKTFTAAAASSAQSISFQAVTDAAGKVSVPVTTSVGAASDRIFVKIQTQTGTSTVTEKVAVVGWKTAATSKLYNKGNNSGVYAVTKTGSVTIPFDVLDNFGKSVATSTQTLRLLVTPQSNSVGAATTAVPVTWAGGVTNVVYNSTATATGSLDLSVKLQYLDSATPAVYQDVSGVSAVTVNLAVVTAVGTPAKITASTYAANGSTAYTDGTSTKPALTLADYVTADLRGDTNTQAAETQVWTNVISGYITASNGAPVEGAAVTVSGKGAQFSVGGTNGSADASVYAADAITVYTNASGLYSVQIASHTAGAIVFTVTSGSATAVSKTITFAAADKTTGASVKITAPAYAAAGRSVPVVVTVVDEYGNAIDTAATDGLVSVSVAGVGYTTTIADNTDASGQIKFNVILSAGDTGSFTITAKYDGDVTASTLSDNAAATATVTIGSAPVAGATAAIAGSAKRFFVSVTGNTTAKNVVVKVAGKTVATLKGSAAKKTYTVAATKGSKKVTVYVGGKLIATKTVSVK